MRFLSVLLIILLSSIGSKNIYSSETTTEVNHLVLKPLHTFGLKQKGAVADIALSPDSGILASVSSDEKNLKLWNMDGKIIRLGVGHTHYAVYTVAFSPDGKTIATGSGDKTVRLWNREGEMLHVLTGHYSNATSVAFSPDGKFLASGSSDNTIIIWDLKGGIIRKFTGHTGTIRDISYSPDGKIIASASTDNDIRLWNTRNGKLIHTLKRHTGWVNSVEFSPDGRLLLSSSDDKTVRTWSLNGKLIHAIRGFTHPVNTASFSPDGRFIATGSSDYFIRLWGINGRLLYSLKAHKGNIPKVLFSGDSRFLFSASRDGKIKVWGIERLNITATSQLEPSGKYYYNAGNILDGSFDTAWVEGKKGDGIGESLSITFPNVKNISAIRIVNGLASGKYWKMNNRVKKLIISTDSEGWFETELKDTDSWQSLKMPAGFNGKKVTFFIGSVYPGTKWQDTAISEVYFDYSD